MPMLRLDGPFFVIEAASRHQRFGWAKKANLRYFYTKTWPFSEVLQVCPFPGLSYGGPHEEYQPRHPYDTYRSSPRALTWYGQRKTEYEIRVAEQVKKTKLGDSRSALESPDSDGSSRLITRIEPFSTSCFRYQKTIASRGVLGLLCNQHTKNRAIDANRSHNLFRDNPVTTSAAGEIFELQMHRLFRQGYHLELFPLRRSETNSKKSDTYNDYAASHREKNSKDFQLAVSKQHSLDEGAELQVDHYYRPPSPNFPTIDSLLLIRPDRNLPPILLMFQITLNQEEHDVKEVGLCAIDRLKLPPDTRRYYVAVTPRGIEPRIKVLKGRFSEVGVFHHPVHPDRLFPKSAGR